MTSSAGFFILYIFSIGADAPHSPVTQNMGEFTSKAKATCEAAASAIKAQIVDTGTHPYQKGSVVVLFPPVDSLTVHPHQKRSVVVESVCVEK